MKPNPYEAPKEHQTSSGGGQTTIDRFFFWFYVAVIGGATMLHLFLSLFSVAKE